MVETEEVDTEMRVSLTNDRPFTIILKQELIEKSRIE